MSREYAHTVTMLDIPEADRAVSGARGNVVCVGMELYALEIKMCGEIKMNDISMICQQRMVRRLKIG